MTPNPTPSPGPDTPYLLWENLSAVPLWVGELFIISYFCDIVIYFLNILFIYFQKRSKRGREASMHERSIDQLPLTPPIPHLVGTWATTQASVLTGNQTGNLSVCRPVLNPLSHTS